MNEQRTKECRQPETEQENISDIKITDIRHSRKRRGWCRNKDRISRHKGNCKQIRSQGKPALNRPQK